jgi:glycosyltransferase involved in cell wall biosynthesis/GT2 family glycosyltransferase
MRVILDGTAFLDRRTGVGVFLNEVTRRLVGRPGLEVGAFAMTLLGYGEFERRVPLGVHAFTRPIPAPQLRRRWAVADDPVIEWWTGAADVVHGPNFLVPPTHGAAEVVTVHDLTPLHYPEMCTEEVRLYPRYIERAANRGAWVHTVSHHVADEVRAHFSIDPERVVVVPNGIVSVPDSDPAVGRALAHGHPYVLAVGTIEPRKDHPSLVRAFDLVADEHPDLRLVVVGGDGWGVDAFESALAGARHADRVVRLGWVSEGDRMALLHGAELLAYASIYEGFGLPPLEAMTAGIPVVATAAGAVPEVVGDAAEVVAVGDVEALAGAMATVLTDEGRRRDLVRLGHRNVERYSWDATADGMVDLYERAAGDRRRSSELHRPDGRGFGSALRDQRRPMVTLTAPPGRRGGDLAEPTTVRIVVLNFNGGDDVLRCVEALRAAPPGSSSPDGRAAAAAGGEDRSELELEVVVVDNASTDGSVEALAARFTDLVIVHNPVNTGFPANNLALRDLEGVRYVGLVNPDVFVEPGWLDPLIACLASDPGVGAACPLMLFEDRFVEVEITSRTSSPGGGDTRQLGVLVSGAWVDGVDVWAGVRVAGVDFGPEQGPDGMFRWTGDRTILRIPVASTGATPASATLELTSVLGPRTVRAVSGGESVEVEAGPEVTRIVVPLAGRPFDLVNNAGSIVFDDGYGADRGYLERADEYAAEPTDVFAFSGGAVLWRPEFLEDVDLLDKRFFLYYEDTDLSWRGAARGWRYRFVPESRVRHRHSAIVGEGSPMSVFYNERNRLMMLVKNAPASLAAEQIAAFAGSIVTGAGQVGVRMARRRGRPMTADRTDLARSWLHGRALAGVLLQSPFLARRRRHLRRVQTVAGDEVVARLVPHHPPSGHGSP